METDKALGANETDMTEENFDENSHRQMWISGPPNREGFFTLSNSLSGKFLTYESREENLKLKGNNSSLCDIILFYD